MPDRPPPVSDLLEIEPGDVLALVGAGGKTTLMFRLAGELCSRVTGC